MDELREADILFAGDPGDPWVSLIARALPEGTTRVGLVGDLPERWPAGAEAAGTLVLHRPTLSMADFHRMRRQRRAGLFPKLILCVGPHARYAHVQPWSDLADAILPEATAAETIARHLATGSAPRRPVERPLVLVLGRNLELTRMLVDALSGADYPTRSIRDWDGALPGDWVLWDVPVLDPDWPEALSRHTEGGGVVVALLGLADRAAVALARSHGAAACLDLPCDPADLAFVLDRLAGSRDAPGVGSRGRADGGHPAGSRPLGAWSATGGRPTMRASRPRRGGP